MKGLLLVLAIGLLLVAAAVPAMARSDHQGLNGCQIDPSSAGYVVDVGFILGGMPPGILVEELGACCVRGHYASAAENGFPGGCCKHPWLAPGPPPTSNDGAPFPMPANLHPGDRDDPRDPPQVGHGCKCGIVRAAH